MKNLLRTLIPLAALALVLTSCGVSVTPSAASVNGTTVSIGELHQALHDAASSTPFRCLLSQQAAVTGAGVHATYSSRFAAEQLSLLIERVELEAEVARLHLVKTSLAQSLATNQIELGLVGSSGSTCAASGAEVFASLPPAYQRLLTTLQVDQDLISAHLAGATLTNAGVQAYSAAHPEIAQLACVSVILVAKRTTAESLIKKINAGASFASVAKANSIDTQTAANGGSLGCVYPGQFAGSLGSIVGSIALNTPSQPIAFSSNYVILEVTQRQVGSPSGAALALVSSQTNAEATYVSKLGAHNSIWVNSAYGTWSVSSGQYQVVSSLGPTNANVLNPNAVTPIGDVYN